MTSTIATIAMTATARLEACREVGTHTTTATTIGPLHPTATSGLTTVTWTGIGTHSGNVITTPLAPPRTTTGTERIVMMTTVVDHPPCLTITTITRLVATKPVLIRFILPCI